MPENEAWDGNAIKAIKGTVQDPEGVWDGEIVPGEEGREIDARETYGKDVYINKSMLIRYGMTEGCPGCETTESGSSRKPHTMACRKRIHLILQETEQGREKSVRL